MLLIAIVLNQMVLTDLFQVVSVQCFAAESTSDQLSIKMFILTVKLAFRFIVRC
jgi:hypothetical protein